MFTPNEKGMNKYAWLIDNLEICYSFGCNVEQDGQASYWTSSAKDDEKAWEVTYDGRLVPDNNKFLRGVRPVISVPKSKFVN